MGPSKKVPWVFVGLGCGFLVLTVAGVIAFMGITRARQIAADMTDPIKRTEKTMRVLGVNKLPEGYHAMRAMDMPFIMEIAMLSDREPNAEGLITRFDEWGFIYVKFARFGPDRNDLKEFFDGRTSDPHALRDNSIEIDIKEILHRGVITQDDVDLMYVSQRGTVGTRGYSGGGIVTLVLVDCPTDTRSHVAFWFGPDPSPGAPVEDLDLSGTPADESELRRFMSQFRFCTT